MHTHCSPDWQLRLHRLESGASSYNMMESGSGGGEKVVAHAITIMEKHTKVTISHAITRFINLSNVMSVHWLHACYKLSIVWIGADAQAPPHCECSMSFSWI